jgi:hypothetical protein
MADFQILEIVKRAGVKNRFKWQLTDYIRDCIAKANLYTTYEEVNRPKAIAMARVVKKNKPRSDKGMKRPE